MAETNLTSSATNNGCEASSPNVPSNAVEAPEGTTRSNAMNMMSAVRPSTNANPSTALWRVVVSEYEAASAQFERNWAAVEAAEEKVGNSEAYRRVKELEQTYGIEQGMATGDALAKIDLAIQHRHFPDSCRHCGRGVEIPDAAIDRMADDGERVLGEWKGLHVALDSLRREHVRPRADEHFRFLSEVYYPAREKLYATPAPDLGGILLKATVLAIEHEEVEGLRDDIEGFLKSIAKGR